jgi:AraC-like DNA-binding protein
MNEYLVRASALEGFAETVMALGGDPAALLSAVGIPADSKDPEAWLPYSALLRLLELAAVETGCPHFGLELSRQQGPRILGTVGFVMQQAPDVGTALAELSRHFAFHNQGADVSLQVKDGVALLGFHVKDTSSVGSRQQYDLSVGVGINILRLLCGPQWTPRGVYFVHSEPEDLRPFRALLRCPLHFDWDTNMMSFDAGILQQPISQANEQLHRILEQHLIQLKQQFPDNLSAQISHLIRQALLTGDCSIERVSSYLSINKRTLQRQLKSAGTSYKELLENVRFDMATRYLLDSNGSLTNLADMLCYAELSAFSNAFKQRFKRSPRQWKKENAAGIAAG